MLNDNNVIDYIKQSIDKVFTEYGLEINTIYKDENSNDIYPVYTITCLHIAPIYFHVKANKNNLSYIVSIIDNTMNLRYESGGYISSLEKALENVMDIYKDDMECHVKLYNIITNNI